MFGSIQKIPIFSVVPLPFVVPQWDSRTCFRPIKKKCSRTQPAHVFSLKIDSKPSADDELDFRISHLVEQVEQCRLKVRYRNHSCTG